MARLASTGDLSMATVSPLTRLRDTALVSSKTKLYVLVPDPRCEHHSGSQQCCKDRGNLCQVKENPAT